MPDTAVDTPAAVHQAFVGNYNNASGGNIGVYTSLPLSATSTPAFTLGSANGIGAPSAIRIGPMGQKVWVTDAANMKIFSFDLPLTSSSQPVVTLNAAAQPMDLHFDPNGNLWVAEFGGKVEEWTVGNLSGASAKTLQAGTGNLFSMAFDATGNLYVAGGTLYMFSNPATASAPTYTITNYGGSISGLAVQTGKLYCGSYTNGVLGYYTLPLNANSAPTTIIASGVFGQKLGFAPTGDMTVPVGLSGSQNKVNFYSAPAYNTLDFSLDNLNDPRSLTYGP
ncbi:MAG TPA: hypothetical protein VL326_30565 [Kofleriaceae bacterium]|nr:hypothetical protein [Kofleriaceae bacterium]